MLPVAADPARMPRVGYAVAAGHPLAVDEADRALRKGANAVEAALVAAFVQGVVDPAKCGIGGWGVAAVGPPDGAVTIAGHINEGDDLFAEDLPFPSVDEGDVVAAINVGSYNASMTSAHCLRPPAKAIVYRDRTC